jgi:hypothetical protein
VKRWAESQHRNSWHRRRRSAKRQGKFRQTEAMMI